ncbi:PstS family phosphate ABC transporter substrate-binding protein [Bacillus massiliigorillae]|uniref:PstS family phosphate ABC transporter substrate-binding protein n=1 Tax=Bacillus massiliigorillae TaxID=1243664 RepID=UPI0003A226B3|nr:PstS family phosphate ABC transporter substrate-binding protein [Bacillus massiliigorillae]
MKGFKYLALAATMTGALALAACGSSDANSKDDKASGNKTTLNGDVAVDGSSTVYPIMEAVSEEYMLEQPDVKVSVGFSGSGGGFKKLIAGDIDMSNASRPIKEEEKQQLKEKGIEYTEFEVAYDGLSVIVNKDNTWVDSLTVAELKKLWVNDGKKKLWSDIRPEWPKEEVKFYSPGTDSGTYDYFNEVILEEQPMVESATLSEDDNVLVQGVSGDKNAIGYFGFAYYEENKDKLKIVPIDGGNGAVEPTHETIKDGTYTPLSRPLFVYANNKSVKDKEQVRDYLKFTLENAGDMAEEVGYVRSPDAKYEEDMKEFEAIK